MFTILCILMRDSQFRNIDLTGVSVILMHNPGVSQGISRMTAYLQRSPKGGQVWPQRTSR